MNKLLITLGTVLLLSVGSITAFAQSTPPADTPTAAPAPAAQDRGDDDGFNLGWLGLLGLAGLAGLAGRNRRDTTRIR